ncbi:malate dehydrogenase (oxaloacetate-decarboxylating) [Wickerhamomyces ciferrii]|uniref:Malate dehydrogenase (Oxaloacetate-decarboxylating) n=1 Tax=Wickerhamomyces ciferrii (strain ATCC 14091 / BCRC 22168 / CBS 111 / JCM 3599 / NBRC 0793 / NRRL Y-1031 F-60-10) TaxID=1206466 RepID=K0KG55_WICCF|nr:malate dehydrogenase (oxaloacetate-decarboxylating) [Wickerhamomyces ciferrii]CCH41177.1 malate dehydrogenase (oxaloacetate-decarboxylating) [Wickerhamomyces ciferrii]
MTISQPQSRSYTSPTKQNKATASVTLDNTMGHHPHTNEIKKPIGLDAKLQFNTPKKTRLTVEGPIECSLNGFQLLNSPLFNKGSAFTLEERAAFGLEGLLPAQVNTLDEQVERAYKQLSYLKTPLAKNDFCTSMRIQNKVLFYELVRRHIRELVPIIYTPTEGDAIAAYSHRFRKPEGCFLDITDPDSIDRRLANFGEDKDVDYIVVSDGEGILGIGDQGVGGVRIAISKLALQTLCGGVHPGRVIPVCLDVGTNNKKLATDDLYMGNRFPRIRGEEYDQFLDKFIQAVKKRFPSATLHFEDFGVTTGRPLLQRYRNQLACFNDDIQGTGAVVMASLSAALKNTDRDLLDSQILIYGAGSAGLGIADQITNHMVTKGLTVEQAKARIHLMDVRGLILDNMAESSTPDQHSYSDPAKDWEGYDTKSLLKVVSEIKPTCLIGCSTQAGAFTKQVIQEMYKHNPRPIVFPLSNPTRLHEAFPVDIMEWTDNNAMIATGSPFKPVDGYVISENNNCFAFPGIGLGSVLSRAKIISDTMISAAVDQLADLSPLPKDPKAGLLPPLEVINDTSAKVAAAVILQALKEGNAKIEDEIQPGKDEYVKVPRDFDSCVEWVRSQMWKPEYRPMIKVEHREDIHTHQY